MKQIWNLLAQFFQYFLIISLIIWGSQLMKGQLARRQLSVRRSYSFIPFIWHLETHWRSDPSEKINHWNIAYFHALKFVVLFNANWNIFCSSARLKPFLSDDMIYRVNSEFVNDVERTGLFVKKWITQHKKLLHSKIRAI